MDDGDCEKGAEGGVASSASVEAEHEFVEVALEMLFSQSVIDAEGPGLGVGEGAVDRRQDARAQANRRQEGNCDPG